MAVDLVPFLILALALGFKHSYDADHLVAVSGLIARSKSLRKTGLMGTSWAIGHMTTASVITFLLYTFGAPVLAGLSGSLQALVAVMLVVIGAVGILWEFNVLHIHEHWHGLVQHTHLHSRLHRHLSGHREHKAMFSIGIVHGVASNDELLMLLVVALGVTTLGGTLLGVGLFSLGVVAGMIVFAVGLNYPLLRWGRQPVRRVVNTGVAVLSIAYAALLFAGMDGFNPLPWPV